MERMRTLLWMASVVTLLGCGGNGVTGSPVDGGVVPGGGDAGGVVADLASSSGSRLVSAEYSLNPGEEAYLCKRFTATRDLNIRKITPVNGLATHHELLGVDLSHQYGDGMVDCTDKVEFDVIAWRMLFASGVGSPSLSTPDGVALVVHAGDQLVFQMHLLNASPKAVQSAASIDIETMAAAEVKSEANLVLAGPLPDSRITADIPVGPNHVVSARCTLKQAVNYFAVFPHMHQTGTHIKVTSTVAGKSAVLHDADYSFANQTFDRFAPIALAPGDSIGVTCTYDNETGKPVHFGQSSLDEMCFAISYVYPPPKNDAGPFCFQ